MGKNIRRTIAAAAAALLAATVLAACGSSESQDDSPKTADKSVTIGYIPWDEDIAVSYLWKHVLEQDGYKVELKQLDVAPTFVGLTKGDIDLFFDTWLPVTHADYWKEYSDKVEDLGAWYDKATLNIAVPEYVDATTIADLKGMEKEFNGTITGIESGAGLTRVTRDEAMKTYGLDGYDLKTSSTSAMLAALKKAVDAEKPIVVTLWHPHWAYAAFPLKDLEDPEGAMGGAEQIHSIARMGFTEDHGDLAKAISDFKMTDEQLASLEDVVLQQNKDDLEGGVKIWAEDNAEFVDSMLN